MAYNLWKYCHKRSNCDEARTAIQSNPGNDERVRIRASAGSLRRQRSQLQDHLASIKRGIDEARRNRTAEVVVHWGRRVDPSGKMVAYEGLHPSPSGTNQIPTRAQGQTELTESVATDRTLLVQGYLNLIKASWILVDIIARHPQQNLLDASVRYS